ncbi:MAG: LamG-like jellyroll fold domain-containing protein [Myxococcota bacterium]
MRRVVSLGLVALLAAQAGSCSCNDSKPPPEQESPPEKQIQPFEEEGAGSDHQPFTPVHVRGANFNRLEPQPWVEPLTQAQTDAVTVRDDALVFPRSGNDDVLGWEPGRVVASAPSVVNPGGNPFGFARRVRSVTGNGETIVVETDTVRITDLVRGDLQAALSEDAREVDISHVDLGWLVDRYYPDIPPSEAGMASDLLHMAEDPDEEPGRDLPVESGSSSVGQPLSWDDFVGAVETGFQVLRDAVIEGNVSFEGTLGQRFEKDFDYGVVDQKFRKEYTTRKSRAVFVVTAEGTARVDGTAVFDPEITYYISVPVRPGASPFAAGAAAAATFEADVNIEVDGEAQIESTDSRFAGDAYTAEIKNRFRKAILGKDVQPANGFRKVLYLSKPQVKTVYAGPVPVVIVTTKQVDLECGVLLNGGITARAELSAKGNVDFEVGYQSENGGEVTGPGYDLSWKWKTRGVTLRGKAEVACGLIPRFNVFLYDAVGLYAGVRTSLVGRVTYKETCPKDLMYSTAPDSTTRLSLLLNMGLRAGARAQIPTSSNAGRRAAEEGLEDSFEPWNKDWELWARKWEATGFGYCEGLCDNDQFDPSDETDVDCGNKCGSCAEGKSCDTEEDCDEGLYCSFKRCSTNHCGDGVQNGPETGLDCGGGCTGCADGKRCTVPTDCMSGFCITPRMVDGRLEPGVCTSDHCVDRRRNMDESGVDCGGRDCPKCADGKECVNPADCATPYWDGLFCVADGCKDNERTEALRETDVDCGGACGRCGVGQRCESRFDCAGGLVCAPAKLPSGAFDFTNRTCQQSTCTDNTQGGDESDVDCGGRCRPCPFNRSCRTDADCAEHVCRRLLDSYPFCAGPSCWDGVANGGETDRDCGGPCIHRCALGEGCLVNSDCDSGVCSTAHHTCVEHPDECFDGIKNGGEVDVDCGGRCRKCGPGERCFDGRDCAAGLPCRNVAGENRCGADTCDNGVKDPDEGDVDCSVLCGACAVGRTCRGPADCVSGACVGGVCAAFCLNDRMDSGEVGVDCAGVCDARCGTGMPCNVDTDCASGTCLEGACLPPDVRAPVPGGPLTIDDVTVDSVILSWEAAVDDRVAASRLEYRVVRADLPWLIASVPAADAATTVMDWTADVTTHVATGLTDVTRYAFAVLVRDPSGNKALYAPVDINTLDGTPPVPGTGITFTDVGATQVTLAWGAATDNGSSTSNLQYRVLRAASAEALDTLAEALVTTGAGIAADYATGVTQATVTSLEEARLHAFAVLVRDEAGNAQLYAPATVTTLDVTPPGPGNGLTFQAITPTSIRVSWGAATDNAPGTLEYQLVRAGAEADVDTVDEAAAAVVAAPYTADLTTFLVEGLPHEGPHAFAVLVRDASGNRGLYPPGTGYGVDVIPPVAGTALTFQRYPNAISVGWGGATDNRTAPEQLEYRLVRANTVAEIDTVGEAAAITGAGVVREWGREFYGGLAMSLPPSTPFAFAVLVRDAAGNTTLYPPDTSSTTSQPPVPGGDIVFTVVTDVMVELTWPPAGDDATGQGLLEYRVVRAATEFDLLTVEQAASAPDVVLDDTAAATTARATGLSPGTLYAFAVLVRDEDGNLSLYTAREQATFSEPDTTPPTPPAQAPVAASDSPNGFGVTWGEATDDRQPFTPEYKLVYSPVASDLDTLEEADAITDERLAMDWRSSFSEGLSWNVFGLTPFSTYTVAVLVRDGSGNKALYPLATVTTDGDSLPPRGYALYVSNQFVQDDQLHVRMADGYDDVTATANLQYRIVKGAASTDVDEVAEVAAAAPEDVLYDWGPLPDTVVSGLSPGTTYALAGVARDEALNVGDPVVVTATTADSTPPTVAAPVVRITGHAADHALTFTWEAAADNAPGTLSYAVYRSSNVNPPGLRTAFDEAAELTGTGLKLGDAIAPPSGTTWSFTGPALPPPLFGNAYHFNVLVTDVAGNQTAYAPVGELFSPVALALEWFFDAGSADAIAAGTPAGVVSGLPTPTVDRFGTAAAALSFAGQQADGVTSAAALGLGGASPRTLAFWFLPDGTNPEGVVVEWGDDAADGHMFGVYVGADQHLHFWGGGAVGFDTGETVGAGWEHWVFAFDGAAVTVYRNGAAIALGPTAVSLATPDAPLTVGRSTAAVTSPVGPCRGSVDDVRVWSGALTAPQVQRLHDATRP